MNVKKEYSKSYFETENGKIIHGDALEILKQSPSESVQMCVTSPPYWGLRSYGHYEMQQIWGTIEDFVPPKKHKNRWKIRLLWRAAERGGVMSPNKKTWIGALGLEPTPELYIQHMVQIFRELRRVLRNDGTLWLNIGDSYCSTAPGTNAPPLRQEGVLSGVKESTANARINYRNQTPDGMKPKDLVGIPWMLAFALRADGWYLRSDIIWHKPNPMPESVTDRPTKAHEYIFLLTKSAKYYYDAEAIKIKGSGNKWGKYSNLKYGDMQGIKGKMQSTKSLTKDEYLEKYQTVNKRTIWTVPTQPMPQAHFATFPEKLIESCILAGTSAKGCCVECGSPWERVVDYKANYEKREPAHTPNNCPTKVDSTGWKPPTINQLGWQPTCKCNVGTEPCVVLDPFGGAMTTAIVAYKHGRKFIMIDLSKTYIDEIGIPRIKKESQQKGWNRFK